VILFKNNNFLILIMRNVNNGWIIRYAHSNIAGIFFILVYLHIGKALYYGSYKRPRILLWNIGVLIFFSMMALNWPKCINLDELKLISLLPLSRVRAINRIGPHDLSILSLLINGMLRDW
jgi:Cytochrome b/b6/petB